MSGPYETEQAAYDTALRIAGADVYAESTTEGNRALLRAAVTLAGVTLGAYDKQILDLVADWEPSTVAVLAGIIIRGSESVGWALTIGQALADAVAWRTAQDPQDGLNAEQIGLYLSAARALGIPGDVARGPGEWHPDAVRGAP